MDFPVKYRVIFTWKVMGSAPAGVRAQFFFNHFFICTVSCQIRALGVCFKCVGLVMHQSIPGTPMPPSPPPGQRQLKGLKACSVCKIRNANAYPHDHHELPVNIL